MSLRHFVEKVACGATRAVFTVLSVFCVSLAIVIIFGTVFTFYHTCFPLVMDLNTPFGHANFALACCFSFGLVFNYVMVVRTGPGYYDPSVITAAELRLAESQRYAQVAKGEGFSLWCRHCEQPKPPRSHYCHVSGALVLKMDHFCPWIGQCVGHFNHRYFVLFLLYLWLSTGYAVVTIGLNWLGVLQNPEVSELTLQVEANTMNLCFVICIALCVVITGFLGWSALLAVTNQTTIEFLFNNSKRREAKKYGEKWENPFDLGLRRNLQQMFGSFRHYWEILVPTTAPLECDGHHWPSIDNDTGSWTDGPLPAEV